MHDDLVGGLAQNRPNAGVEAEDIRRMSELGLNRFEKGRKGLLPPAQRGLRDLALGHVRNAPRVPQAPGGWQICGVEKGRIV